MNNTTGKKNDEGKARVDLVDPEFILGTAKVLAFGADKYGENNWQKVDNFDNRYYAAAMRHLLAWRSGETDDTESGMNHLYHAACNLMFLIHGESE